MFYRSIISAKTCFDVTVANTKQAAVHLTVEVIHYKCIQAEFSYS